MAEKSRAICRDPIISFGQILICDLLSLPQDCNIQTVIEMCKVFVEQLPKEYTQDPIKKEEIEQIFQKHVNKFKDNYLKLTQEKIDEMFVCFLYFLLFFFFFLFCLKINTYKRYIY